MAKKFSLEDVKSFIEESGCNLISDEYVNIFSNLKIKMKCGHIREMTFSNFKKGQRCRLCSWKEMGLKKRISKDDILSLIEENNLNLISISDAEDRSTIKIVFSCSYGHTTEKSLRSFMQSPHCRGCSNEKMSRLFSGENSPTWKGGKTDFREFFDEKLKDWKELSMEMCGYKCIVTGDRFDHIHHLYSFSKIVDDSLCELNINPNSKISDFSSEEMRMLSLKIEEIHFRHPLGVCLRKDVHKLFHKIYGKINNTPDQFYEFYERIMLGEISV